MDTYAEHRLASSDSESFKELLSKTLVYSDSAKAYFAETTD